MRSYTKYSRANSTGVCTNIRDTIFSYIYVDDTAEKIIEDEHMQRLRYVKQLAFAYLVYPGANHTRFEHSLGTYHVTKTIMQNIGAMEINEVAYVGLLHDIGHAAFSHISDFALERYLKKTHEEIGEEIISSSCIKDILSDAGLSFKKFVKYFKGAGPGALVTGALGSDRIDYLIRDSYYTGVAYGAIDYNRLINKIALSLGVPALYKQAITSAESLLIARYLMFSSVYYHHTVAIAGGMYGKALSNAIEHGAVEPKLLSSYNDWELVSILSSEKSSKEIMQRILSRRLFKRVYDGEIPDGLSVSDLEGALGKAGFAEDDYIIDNPSFKIKDYDLPVIADEGKHIGMLSESSPLIRTLASAMNNTNRLLIACDVRNVSKAKRVISKELRT